MTRWGSRSLHISIWIVLPVIALLVSACGGGRPVSQPTATPSPLPPSSSLVTQTPAQPAAATSVPTPAPTERPGYAPGTVILDQSNSISVQSGSAEMSFESGAMQVVRVDANSLGGLVDYELRVVDMFNNIIGLIDADPNQTNEAISEITLPYQGTYRIELVPLSGTGTIQVIVTALDAPSGGGTLNAVGESLTGVMSVKRVYHTYQFSLMAGEVVTISAEAESNGAPDPQLVLYGPDGRFVAESDDVQTPENLNATLPGFVASLSGLYTAIVTNYGGTTGTYTFRVISATAPPEVSGEPDLVYDTDYRAALFEGSPLIATFDGTIGDVLRVEAFGLTPELDVDLRVYSPFGQVIAYALNGGTGENEAINEMQLPYTGRYRLEITPTGNGQASFRIRELTVSDLTGGGILGDETSGTRPGRINTLGVFHYYLFHASAGDRITIRLRSSVIVGQLDLGFAVIGPGGHQMVFADDSEGTNPRDPELVDYEVSQTGSYVIVVYAFNDALGTYELSYMRQE